MARSPDELDGQPPLVLLSLRQAWVQDQTWRSFGSAGSAPLLLRAKFFSLSPFPHRVGRRHVRGDHVTHMHPENFEEVVRRLGLTTVEVEHIGWCFLVGDRRIPRHWLRERPCEAC